MIDLNLGISLLFIGVVMFAIFMISATSCFMSEFENFMHTLMIISVILMTIGVVVISSHVVLV